ncbi:DUF998 domain-containing protein [Halobacillus massiliensis]|uniref:DUF998 domain-containing protein n=1 Tax=Halobacillus massiliensis TaxID=1926286 RepID=UPI001FE4632E|nr:DUF998 domain-containing protein [Halobacillus massiliensis]
MSIHYFIMAGFIILSLAVVFFIKHPRRVTVKVGLICWILLSVYFLIEYLVIQKTTAVYQFMVQPMSDLGVTACGTNTYVLAPYDICSPYHLLMNWTFTLTGIVILVGAVYIHPLWPKQRKTRAATILFVIFGLSYAVSGVFPADVHFLWHTLGSLPGMVVQIPALLMIALSIRGSMPKLSLWTALCAVVTSCSLLLLFYQPEFIYLPAGLLQRTLYGSVYLWMAVTAILLWNKKILLNKFLINS